MLACAAGRMQPFTSSGGIGEEERQRATGDVAMLVSPIEYSQLHLGDACRPRGGLTQQGGKTRWDVTVAFRSTFSDGHYYAALPGLALRTSATIAAS